VTDEPRGTLPNLVVIGAMNCGTTSFYHYLRWHPEIHMSTPKELHFFAKEWNWGRGLTWYSSHFSTEAAVNGEISPLYTTFPEHLGIAARMHRVIPAAKLIYLVRDPIERMITHYIHYVSADREHDPLTKALTRSTGNRYLERSRYWTQLEQYLEHYDPDQILVLQSEGLAQDRAATLQRAFEFLGVDPGFNSRRFRVRRHVSSRKRVKTRTGRRLDQVLPVRLLRRLPNHFRWPLEDALFYPFSRRIPRPVPDEEVRRFLANQLAGEVEQLRSFTGEAFADWSIPA
jgi:hypothetical protein